MCFSFGRWRLETSWSHAVSDETCDFRVFFANGTINHDETCNMSAFVVHLRSLKQIYLSWCAGPGHWSGRASRYFWRPGWWWWGNHHRGVSLSQFSPQLCLQVFLFVNIWWYKVLSTAVHFNTQVDFWQWKSQWDVSRQTSFWYFFQKHACCNAALWRCLKKTFHGRFSLQVLLGPHTPAGCGYESWYASLHLAEQTAQHAFRWSARLQLGRQAGCWSSTGQPTKRNTMKQRIRDTSIVEIDRNT